MLPPPHYLRWQEPGIRCADRGRLFGCFPDFLTIRESKLPLHASHSPTCSRACLQIDAAPASPGALKTVPYGMIRCLVNENRDWTIVMFEFRLAYGTNIRKIKRIFK